MPKFESAELKTSFSAPDALTVRQQLAYKGALGARAGQDLFIRAWMAGLPLFQDWRSEYVPDPAELDLDTETNPVVTDVVLWAGMQVFEHAMSLERVEKN